MNAILGILLFAAIAALAVVGFCAEFRSVPGHSSRRRKAPGNSHH